MSGDIKLENKVQLVITDEEFIPIDLSNLPNDDEVWLLDKRRRLSISDQSLARSHLLHIPGIKPCSSVESNLGYEEPLYPACNQLKPTPVLPEKSHPTCYLYRNENNMNEPLAVYFKGIPQDDDIVIYSKKLGNKTWKELKAQYPTVGALHLWFPLHQWYIHNCERQEELNEREKAENKIINDGRNVREENKNNSKNSSNRSAPQQSSSRPGTREQAQTIQKKNSINSSQKQLIPEKRENVLQMLERLSIEKLGCTSVERTQREIDVNY